MKLDRRNPAHWLLLAGFFGCALVARMARPFMRRAGKRRVVFYGHRFAGNLLPIARALESGHADRWEACFLTMDRGYCRELRDAGERTVFAVSWAAVRWLATADAVVSDHGLHALQLLLGARGLRFFDAWHGIPFKGFDGDDFRVQHRYDETWVASPLLARLYTERFGFDAARVQATGYARTDALVRGNAGVAEIRRAFGLPATGRIVLFAPTWKQDARDRSLYPFGVPEPEFLALLSRLAQRHGATTVVRTHLNSGRMPAAALPGVLHRPFGACPDTEALLLATDLLVCDWSSIAFDYLLLGRPAIFLDVAPPFRKGLSLDASYRYGPVAGDPATLVELADRFLSDDTAWASRHAPNATAIRERVYGACADGNAAARCVARLVAPSVRP